MKLGDLVTWTGPARALRQGYEVSAKSYIGLIVAGPTHFGFNERVCVVWCEYPEAWPRLVSHEGSGNQRWVDTAELKVISEGKQNVR